MKDDAIMQELRATREKIEAERKKNHESLADYLVRLENEYQGKLIDLSANFKAGQLAQLK